MLPWQAEQQIFTLTRIALHTPSTPAPFPRVFLFFSSSAFSHLLFPPFPSSLFFLHSAFCPIFPKRDVAASVRSRGQGRSLHRSSIQAFTPQSLQLSHSRLLKEPNHSLCPFFSLSAAQVSQWSWPIHLLVAHLNLKCMQNTWPHTHKHIHTRTPYVSRLETSHRHLKKIYFQMWALLGLALSKNVISFNYSAHKLNYRSIKLKQDSSRQALQSASTHIVCLIITLINHRVVELQKSQASDSAGNTYVT